MSRQAHGQTDPHKTGPRPKEMVEATIEGLPVGRDKTVVPPDQVYELAAIGCTDREISRFFGIREDTLRYNFTEEIIKGREFVKIRLRRALFENATKHMNAATQIFLAKQSSILGMSDSGVGSDDSILPWIEGEAEELEHGQADKTATSHHNT